MNSDIDSTARPTPSFVTTTRNTVRRPLPARLLSATY